MGLSEAEVKALYATKRSNKKAVTVTGKYLDADGWHDISSENPLRKPSERLGSFVGRVGSVTRSRKGVTRRAPNGSRKISQPDGFWEKDGGDKDARPILAYKLYSK